MPSVPLKAPTGKYRVVCVYTFEGDDWVHGDFDTLDAARSAAERVTTGKQMLRAYVYDGLGSNRAGFGNY